MVAVVMEKVEIEPLKSQWTEMPSLTCNGRPNGWTYRTYLTMKYYHTNHFQKILQGHPEVLMSKVPTICPLHCQKEPRGAYQNRLRECSVKFCETTLADRCAEMNLLRFQAMGMHENSPTNVEMGIETVAGDTGSMPLEPLLVDEDEPSSNAAEVCEKLQSIPEVPRHILHIQHFEGPKDWCHRQEIDVECNDNRDLNLIIVLQKLCMNGKVVVRMISQSLYLAKCLYRFWIHGSCGCFLSTRWTCLKLTTLTL